ncbi:hypothetical protein EDD21DRAFT_377970 [Dissophora ornata]|nr:hypothetical protein EDD21DRAFT_377970 [Dissophora ornata]
MTDLTAEEMALEAMLESRLESISARLHALTHASKNLSTETQELFTVIQAKFQRMYVLEDNLLRIQGKPGLSNIHLETGPQLVPILPAHMRTGVKGAGIRDSDIEEIKMGVKTLRRKFHAASAVVTTVGWWRHLKDKEKNGSVAASGVPIEVTMTPVEPPVPAVPVVPAVPTTPIVAAPPAVVAVVPVVPMIGFNAAAAAIKANKANKAANMKSEALSVDTSLQTQLSSPHTPPLSTPMSPTHLGKSGVIWPKTMLSPTSPSTKKRNTLTLQQIFTPPASATVTKPLKQRERANPALGLCSPPTSPMAPEQTPTAENTLMRRFSLRS